MRIEAVPADLAPGSPAKLPADWSAAVRRGEWKLGAMEHARVDAVAFDAPGAPFHHLALPPERVPLRFGPAMDGRRQVRRAAPDTLATIEAGAGGRSG